MKKVLVKAALPTLAESGHGIDDIKSLRWIPTRHEKTFAKPMPLFNNPSNMAWEIAREKELAETKGNTDNVFSERTPIPNWRFNPEGTFVSPATQQGIPRDTNIGVGTESTMLGILDSPNFSRTQREGARFGTQGEGFQFGGFDPSRFVKLPTSQRFRPVNFDRYHSAINDVYGISGARNNLGPSLVDEMQTFQHQFPDVPMQDIWGPSSATLNPQLDNIEYSQSGQNLLLTNPFIGNKVASEPMDLAMRLLKAGIDVLSEGTSQPSYRHGYTSGSNAQIQPQSAFYNVYDSNHVFYAPLEAASINEAIEGIDEMPEGKEVDPVRTSTYMMLNRIPEGNPDQYDADFKGQWASDKRPFVRYPRFDPEAHVKPTVHLRDKPVQTGEPMDLSWRLLKENDIRRNISEYAQIKNWGTIDEIVDHIFAMGYPKTPFLSMNDNQLKLLNQMIFNHGTDGKPTSPSYWREPFQEADYDYESEILMGDGMEHIPDEVYDEITRYHQHYNDAVDELPGGADPSTFWEKQLHHDLMSQDPIPETHPHNIAEQRMQNEYPHWGKDDVSFGNRYGIVHEERQFTPEFDDTSWQGDLERAEPMDLSWRMLKGQEYHPSVGGYLEQGQTMVTNSGNVIPRLESSYRMDPENPGQQMAIQQPVQEQPVQEQPVQEQPVQEKQTYDGRPMPEERIELDDSFWDDMYRGKDKSKHNQWERITPQEKEEVKERVTTGLQGLINPDGSWNDWAMENLKQGDKNAKGGAGPTVAIRTHLFGPDGHRRSPRENDSSNGDSIISIVNAHSKRGITVPGFRTVMFRVSDYNGPHKSQPFKADGEFQQGQKIPLGSKNVIDHAPELDDNGGRIALHGVSGKKRKEWKRRWKGDRRRKGYPVYVLNQLGDVLVKAQQTIDAYNRKNIEEGFEPGTQNVIISSRPGAENITSKEQSRLHDEMLRRISQFKNSEDMRIISARGQTDESQGNQQDWKSENSFMLTNVPDDIMPEIHSLAGEFNQHSILHSPEGTAGTQFVDSSGESEGGLEEGNFTEGTPPNYTEFPTGQKYAYGDYVAASEPMSIGDVLVKDRVSPEAKRHKLEYDTAYEANPERRKYRADLNRERRRRGMYGSHDHRDISHTEGNKLTVESEHANRARHFKNQGTLRHVGIAPPATSRDVGVEHPHDS